MRPSTVKDFTRIELKSPVLLISGQNSIMAQVSAARYGKDNIRVYKVHKDETTGFQTVVEMTVCVLLKGDIETS